MATVRYGISPASQKGLLDSAGRAEYYKEKQYVRERLKPGGGAGERDRDS